MACFSRSHAEAEDGYTRGVRAGGAFRRLVSASVSQDFIAWSRPWRVLMPEPRDEGQLEFYSVGGTIARGGLLIGFARMLHDDYPANEGRASDGAAAGSEPPSGIGYATLVTSRDGVRWERHDEVFFDRNPDPDAWDRAMTWIGSAVPVDDELYIYYGGYKRGHKIEPTRERQLGLAKMPMDRFVSREAVGDKPGRILTVPLRLPEDGAHQLVLNANATTGQIRVQLRDAEERGRPAGLSLSMTARRSRVTDRLCPLRGRTRRNCRAGPCGSNWKSRVRASMVSSQLQPGVSDAQDGEISHVQSVSSWEARTRKESSHETDLSVNGVLAGRCSIRNALCLRNGQRSL